MNADHWTSDFLVWIWSSNKKKEKRSINFVYVSNNFSFFLL